MWGRDANRMGEDETYTQSRLRMVEFQLANRDIKDQRVLEAMRQVPRHLFISEEYRSQAYIDGPLPIGNGQTISQPYIVALMSQLLGLQGDEIVLEVGTGSGYQAAVLGCLAREVHTIERHPALARQAERVLAETGMGSIHVHTGDGTLGLAEYAPFDGILVTAAAPRVPQKLLDQLVDGGSLVIPVGERYGQYLEHWRRSGDEFTFENVTPVAFVPLIGKDGWSEDSRFI